MRKYMASAVRWIFLRLLRWRIILRSHFVSAKQLAAIRKHLDGAGLLALLVGVGLSLTGLLNPWVGFGLLFFAFAVLLHDILRLFHIRPVIKLTVGVVIFSSTLYVFWTPMVQHVEPKVELSIELAPRVVHYVLKYQTGGEAGRQNEYGFAAVIRIRNDGKSSQQLKSLEITGDIDAGISYHVAFGPGKTPEEIDIEYGKRKPYLRLSFVAFPTNSNRIEASGEEFIRFMILDPTKLGTQGITRGAEAERYIGFRGENAAEPELLQTVPSISFFARPKEFLDNRPGNAQWTGIAVRDEIKTGRLRFTARFNSGPQIVIPSKINDLKLIGLDDWNKQTPQEIFFDMDRRFMPVEKDPLLERPQR